MSEISLENKTVLVTGAAGFIGFYLCKALLEKFDSIKIIGFDCLSDYYDVSLKQSRLKILSYFKNRFVFVKGDISNKNEIDVVFAKFHPNIVVNLAAQAGVRCNQEAEGNYINSNIMGFFNVLECCRQNFVEHFIFASSSSVYGMNKKSPYSESDKTDMPLSL